MGFLDRFRSSGPSRDDVLERPLLAPTPYLQHAPGDVTREEELSFIVVHDDEGLPVVPAFTSEEALARWKPEGSPYVTLDGKVLVEILAESDWNRMVIDGADTGALGITRADARRMVRITSLSLPAGSIRIGHPAKPPPDGLVQALLRACERESAVSEAYLYHFQHVELDERPHLAIGLELGPSVDEPDVHRIARSITELVELERWGYEFIDIHFLEGDLLEMVRANGPPVFSAD